jgi:hypothetical protein
MGQFVRDCGSIPQDRNFSAITLAMIRLPTGLKWSNGAFKG